MRHLLLAMAAVALTLVPSDAFAQAYAEGQIWQYKNRPQDAGSQLKIQKIETIGSEQESMTVYHLSIVGLNVPGMDGTLAHIPVSKRTLDDSVTNLFKSATEFPDPTEGIRLWREANGGLFTISIAEIVQIVEESVPTKARTGS